MLLRMEMNRFLWYGASHVIEEYPIPYTEIGRDLFVRQYTSDVVQDAAELFDRIRRVFLGGEEAEQ